MSELKKKRSVSESGQPVYRYGEPASYQPPRQEGNGKEIMDHVERYLGDVDRIYHEIVSEAVHVDILILHPTEDYPFARMVTSGMSDLPMSIPEDADAPRYAELMMTLPASWRTDQKSFNDEKWSQKFGQVVKCRLCIT